MPSGSPNRPPVKRDALFLEPSFHYLSQFPVNGPPPQVPQWDPYRKRHPSTEPSTSHPLKIHISLRVPGKGDPPCSLRPEILRHQRHWSISSCKSARVTKKEPSYKMLKIIRSPSMEPHIDGRPTYNGVPPGSPRGLLTTLLPVPQCHAALSMVPSTLPLVDQSPISQHIIATPIRKYPPQLLPPPT